MIKQKCIFCQDDFLEAPPEHVIPKSIGGQYTIHNVCKQCNHKLNHDIDEPFKKHVLIATYRVIFSSNGRRNKTIPDPLSRERIFLDGTEYSLRLNKEDLTASIKMMPKFPKKSDLKIGESFKIEIDTDSVSSYLEKVASHLGVSSEEIVITDIKSNYRPATTQKIKTDNNVILLEFSKILFQTASNLFGKVFNEDSFSKKYRDMLISGKIDNSLEYLISPQQNVLNGIFSQLLSGNTKLNKKHLIILSGIEGLGLVGFLKIYDLYHIQILSTSNVFFSSGIKIITNDFENKTLKILEPNQLSNCSLDINRNQTPNHKKLLNHEFSSNALDKDYAVFNMGGEQVAKTIFELLENKQYLRTGSTDFETFFGITLFFNEKIFIKSKSTELMLPIKSVTYNYSFSVINT